MHYFVIQVATGREQIFIDNLKKLNPALAQAHKFIYFTRELTIRRGGKNLKELQPLFPSYVIMQTENMIDAETLIELKKLPDFYHFLNSNTEIVPLNDKDLCIIKHFMGIGPKLGSSRVRFDENDRIAVCEGPLKGMEGNIIKVDRRKQRAKIQLNFHGSTYTLDLSFEDITKES